MSQQKVSLALGFMDAQPKAAAEIIELQTIQHAADFIASIPAEKAARVITEMLPQYAAPLCLQLPTDAALAILMKIQAKHLVHIFRLFPATQRDHFLKALPTKTQVACTLILNYPEAMVGAWITPQMLTIPHQSTVAQALHRVEKSDLPIIGDNIFIVDRNRQLKSRVPLIDLIRAPKAIPVTAVFQGQLFSINGRMSVTEAAASPFWEHVNEIPVLNRRQEFIGILRHPDLQQAIKALREPSQPRQESPDLLTGISQGYGQTLLALLQSMQEFMQSERPPKIRR